MCGFVGYVGEQNEKILKKMTDKIKHRGPDSEGYYISDNVNFGFRRLSIVGVDKNGDQPIYNEDKTLVMVFNGEIYNYKDLRKDLIKKGYKFKSKSDTEVIIHGYEEYKEEILNKLRGMFAFVIYDIKNDLLFGARDFYGIKPFYYYQDESNFMFASEIKAFLENPNFKKELNEDKLSEYLTFQYSPGTTTFFKNVYKLLPGHYFKYKGGLLNINKYYQLEFDYDYTKNETMFEKELEELLYDSIEVHKDSKIKVGSILTNEIDSYFLSTVSDVNKIFAISFDMKEYNEIESIKEISSKINTLKKITKKEYFTELNKVQYYMDEPLADPSAINLYILSKLIKPHLKVVLSKEGIDEIFCGYSDYREYLVFPFYYKIPFFIRKGIGVILGLFGENKITNFFIKRSGRLEDRYIGNSFIFTETEKKRILKNYNKKHKYNDVTKAYYNLVKDKDDITKMQHIDISLGLPGNNLLKLDKMSMANSIEIRTPFLDKILVDYAIKIPIQYKVDEKETKKMFRRIVSKKLGETKKDLKTLLPLDIWLKDEDIVNKIRKEFSKSDKFFKVEELIKLLDNHVNGKKDNSKKIWTIYTYLIWYKEYFN